MSVLNENTIIGASAAGGEFEIDHSLRLHNRGVTEQALAKH